MKCSGALLLTRVAGEEITQVSRLPEGCSPPQTPVIIAAFKLTRFKCSDDDEGGTYVFFNDQ